MEIAKTEESWVSGPCGTGRVEFFPGLGGYIPIFSTSPLVGLWLLGLNFARNFSAQLLIVA